MACLWYPVKMFCPTASTTGMMLQRDKSMLILSLQQDIPNLDFKFCFLSGSKVQYIKIFFANKNYKIRAKILNHLTSPIYIKCFT